MEPAHSFIAGGLFVVDAAPVVRRWPAILRLPADDGASAEARLAFDLRYAPLSAIADIQAADARLSAARQMARAWRDLRRIDPDAALPAGYDAAAIAAVPDAALEDEDWPAGTPADPLWDRLVGWHGLATEAAGALPQDDAARALILRDSRLRRVVFEALVSLAQGLPAKNFETSPAPGPAAGPPAGRRAPATKGRSRAGRS
ncbi:MAG: hypothetical protein OHK0024_36870 [Thalassobaculales bacterium]